MLYNIEQLTGQCVQKGLINSGIDAEIMCNTIEMNKGRIFVLHESEAGYAPVPGLVVRARASSCGLSILGASAWWELGVGEHCPPTPRSPKSSIGIAGGIPAGCLPVLFISSL